MILAILLTRLLSPLSASSADLNGIWLRGCHQSKVEVQYFENGSNSNSEVFFKDARCSRPLISFINEGSYTLPSQNEINFIFEKVIFTIYDEALVQDFNKRKVCGLTDWQSNSAKEITGMKCALFQDDKFVQIPKVGDARYGIWKIEMNQKLFFGKLSREENGQTPESRPTQWDPLPYFIQK